MLFEEFLRPLVVDEVESVFQLPDQLEANSLVLCFLSNPCLLDEVFSSRNYIFKAELVFVRERCSQINNFQHALQRLFRATDSHFLEIKEQL